MRLILVLIVLTVILLLVSRQLKTLTPTGNSSAETGVITREYFKGSVEQCREQLGQHAPEQLLTACATTGVEFRETVQQRKIECYEALGPEADEEEMARCVAGTE